MSKQRVTFLQGQTVLETRTIEKCFPNQIQPIPEGTGEMQIVWVDDEGRPVNQMEAYIIGSRQEVSNLIRASGKGTSQIFLDNTARNSPDQRYVFHLRTADTRLLELDLKRK